MIVAGLPETGGLSYISGRNLRAFGPEVFLRLYGELGNVNVLELKGLDYEFDSILGTILHF